jgi:hypothetical protein
MAASYSDLLAFVQHLTPTWRKTQHNNLTRLLAALLERPTLCLSELARAFPSTSQPLHGRLKHLMRFLDNPRLDETALFVRWLHLAYHFSHGPPQPPGQRPFLPVLLDTTYFGPFALLLASVPCGSRGLPIALTTYHRSQLQACFPPRECWPRAEQHSCLFPPRRGQRPTPGAAVVTPFLSQNQIEEHLLDYLFTLLSPALRVVLVADRGFARASLFWWLQARQCDFVIRIDAQTHIRLPAPLAPGRPTQGTPAEVVGLQPGQRLWCPQAWYGKEEQVPISLLALWEVGQKEPWYLATSLERAEATETLYRWRMRQECTHRDQKTGVLLREGGDQHGLKSLRHLHRLMLALATAQWLCALTGLQAWQELAHPKEVGPPVPPTATGTPAPAAASARPSPRESVAPSPPLPPPVVPHRGAKAKVPGWMRRFAARGPLSYVRLGLEVLRCADLGHILYHLVGWLGEYLWLWRPLWRPWQLHYRLKHWWLDSS